jgi:hypothetical protein
MEKTGEKERLRVVIRGAVQGVGFRPFCVSPGEGNAPAGLGVQFSPILPEGTLLTDLIFREIGDRRQARTGHTGRSQFSTRMPAILRKWRSLLVTRA